MKKILLIGAGLSSNYLIKYLTTWVTQNNAILTVADFDLALILKKVQTQNNIHAQAINVQDTEALNALVQQQDIVVSLMPPALHLQVAKSCLLHKKNLVTASYLSPEMLALNQEALDAGLIFLNECGLDPGIDHLSAMKAIHEIKEEGGNIHTFKSYCGGLIAPEFDNNPWGYKFTWNPRNVILAGQATAKYKLNNEIKYIPPSRIFSTIEKVMVNGRLFDGYANRDSLTYINPYGLQNAHTVLRGTLRKAGFCISWDNLVKLGLTDDQQILENLNQFTYRQWLSGFTPGQNINQLENRVKEFLNMDNIELEKLVWLGLFEDKKIPLTVGTSAQILQQLLQQKWALQPGDLDQIVMQHEFGYAHNGKQWQKHATLIINGEDEHLTAMAKTVGLPLGIATKLILQNQIKQKGVCIPLTPEFYNPMLAELSEYGIAFMEKTISS